jgi:hypothetical protein
MDWGNEEQNERNMEQLRLAHETQPNKIVPYTQHSTISEEEKHKRQEEFQKILEKRVGRHPTLAPLRSYDSKNYRLVEQPESKVRAIEYERRNEYYKGINTRKENANRRIKDTRNDQSNKRRGIGGTKRKRKNKTVKHIKKGR